MLNLILLIYASLFFTRAFSEIKNIMLKFGGKQDTIFNYCGIGDF